MLPLNNDQLNNIGSQLPQCNSVQNSICRAGISSSPTTIEPSVQHQSKDFFSQIAAWISKAVNLVRGVLARVPWIGTYFKIEDSFEEIPHDPNFSSQILSDQAIVNMIKEVFASGPPVKQDLIDAAVEQFKSIHRHDAKMEAFLKVISSPLATQKAAILFYETLPKHMQDDLKTKIYKEHGSDVFEGVPHTVGFADYMIYHQYKHKAVLKGTEKYLATLKV